MTKETMGTLKAATNPPSREQLLAEVALEVQALAQQKQHPLKGYKPTKESPPGEQVLDELRAVRGIVEARATPEEADAFKLWLVAAAQAAAEAAKDGGFVGIGAHLVSEREQAMLDQVRQAVRRSEPRRLDPGGHERSLPHWTARSRHQSGRG